MGNREALLVHCAKSEAQKIREIAKRQRRTISGYVLYVLMRAVRLNENLMRMRAAGVNEVPFAHLIETYGLNRAPAMKAPGPRTTMLLWCSKQEAQRVRTLASKRGLTISAFVLHTLTCTWRTADETRQ